MLCLIKVRMTSVTETFNTSARSLTIICGGSDIGPVGFSFTAGIRRSGVRDVALPEGRDGRVPGPPERPGPPGPPGPPERPGPPGRPVVVLPVCCTGRCAGEYVAGPVIALCGERYWEVP